MTRADDLRALADQVEKVDALTAAYVAAQDALRAAPDDPTVRATYRAASDALARARSAAREAAGRQGLAVGGDMIRSEN